MPSNTAPRISLPQILAYIAMAIVVILIGLPLIWMPKSVGSARA